VSALQVALAVLLAVDLLFSWLLSRVLHGLAGELRRLSQNVCDILDPLAKARASIESQTHSQPGGGASNKCAPHNHGD
jgi:hypothetical protein